MNIYKSRNHQQSNANNSSPNTGLCLLLHFSMLGFIWLEIVQILNILSQPQCMCMYLGGFKNSRFLCCLLRMALVLIILLHVPYLACPSSSQTLNPSYPSILKHTKELCLQSTEEQYKIDHYKKMFRCFHLQIIFNNLYLVFLGTCHG